MSSLLTTIGIRLSPKAIYAIILLMIFGVALSLRVFLPYEDVFVGDWVRFGLNDPWYHMRLVENLVQHFPYRITFDSFTLFPYGQEVPFVPFFDLLLGFVIWVIGLGSPSQHTIEVVGAYFPAILGALVTVPVYFIGKELFNRNVGLLSAGLVAILPGEFIFRSLLGFTDHHIAEVLLSAVAALFLILAIKSAREKDDSPSLIPSLSRQRPCYHSAGDWHPRTPGIKWPFLADDLEKAKSCILSTGIGWPWFGRAGSLLCYRTLPVQLNAGKLRHIPAKHSSTNHQRGATTSLSVRQFLIKSGVALLHHRIFHRLHIAGHDNLRHYQGEKCR